MTEPFRVPGHDRVILARITNTAKVARDAIDDRDARIAEAITDDGLEIAVVAKAAGLTPAEVAAIVFAQEMSPSPFSQLRRSVRARTAIPPDDDPA